MVLVTPPASRLDTKRILVVEDEALVVMLLEAVLRRAGASTVITAFTLPEALTVLPRAMADGGLDVAVLDIGLHDLRVWPVADQLADLRARPRSL